MRIRKPSILTLRSVMETCLNTGCFSTCFATCADGTCSVDRKHFRTGGVCCMSCYDMCARCDGAFYHEGLTTIGEDADGDSIRVCHCCLIAEKERDDGRE